jgi:hypothetical protein
MPPTTTRSIDRARGSNPQGAVRRDAGGPVWDPGTHVGQVAELTGRKVIAMMSANHLNPDLAAEIYVLDGALRYRPAPCDEATNSQPLADGASAGRTS